MSIQDRVSALSAPLPQGMVKQRKQGGAQIDYISWHDACDVLDELAPGWECHVKEIGALAGHVYVRVALTIDGVTRENIGCESEEKSGYGDPFSNAYAMALKRAAALFGLARDLYDKEDRPRGKIGPTEYWPAAKAKLGDDGAREHLKRHGGDFGKAYAAL